LTGNKGIGSGKAQKFAVETHGVEDYVLGQFKNGKPATHISTSLKDEKGLKISPFAITRWLKRIQVVDGNTNIRSRQKFEVMAINYQNEISNILDEVKEMKNIAKTEKDLKAYDKMVGRLYQGLELLAKLMGDMKGEKKQVDVNILINEISQRTFEKNRGLRHRLHGAEIIDVEVEISDEDLKRAEDIKSEEKP